MVHFSGDPGLAAIFADGAAHDPFVLLAAQWLAIPPAQVRPDALSHLSGGALLKILAFLAALPADPAPQAALSVALPLSAAPCPDRSPPSSATTPSS